MWETIGYHKNKIFAILLVIGIFYGMYVPEEEIEDPYNISIDFDCREVMRDTSDTPRIVIEECRMIMEKLDTRYEPKSNKHSTTT